MSDRGACVNDISLCELALKYGVTHYNSGAGVQERLEADKRIIAIIDAELERRGE